MGRRSMPHPASPNGEEKYAPPGLPKWGGKEGKRYFTLLPPLGGRLGWGQVKTSPNGEVRKVKDTLRSFPHLGEGWDGGKLKPPQIERRER